jgi:ABC-type uncharacterized transport system auxiliary subunit
VRRGALLLAVLLLAACGGGASPPPDSFYRLEAGDPGRRYGTPLLDGTVEVARFDADGVTGGRPIVYHADGPQLRRYSYHYWVESPTKQMQAAVIAALRRAEAARQVVRPDMRVPADWRISGTLKELSHRPGDGGAAGRIVLAATLSVVDARDGALVLLEDFRVERPVQGDGVPAAVARCQTALTELLGRFLDRLAEVRRPG